MKTSIVYQQHGTLTFLYLRLGITTETDSAVNPLYLTKQSGIFGSDKPGIKSLIEIYPQPEVDDLLELLLSVGTSRKNVVVHQYDMCAPLNGYLLNIHIRTYCTFFLRDNTPKTVIRASLRQLAVSHVLWHIGKDGIVRLQPFYLGGQSLLYVISRTSLFEPSVGILPIVHIWRKVEYLARIYHVVVILVKQRDRTCPFYRIAICLVPSGQLAKRHIGIDVPAFLSMTVKSINVNQSYSHTSILTLLILYPHTMRTLVGSGTKGTWDTGYTHPNNSSR